MNLNYILLPEVYIPRPLPANIANDDKMDVDEISMAEPMEVDVIEFLPEQQETQVTDHLPPLPVGEPMEIDSVSIQRWLVLPRPAWNVNVADYAPARRWPVLPRPAWNVDAADYAHISPALIVGGTRISRRSPRKPNPQKTTGSQQSAPPSSSLIAKRVVIHPDVNMSMSKTATSSKVKLEDIPTVFASVETSSGGLNVAQHVTFKEPGNRCTRNRFSSPLSPVKQLEIDDNLFVTSNRQSPNLINNDRWLKISRTPGRNIGNESVFEDCSNADYSRLAIAYPPTQDADTLFPEIKHFSPVRHARMDEDFFLTSNRQTPDLAVNNRWLKISRTPDHNIHNESTTTEYEEDECYLSLDYPPSEITDESHPDIDFAEADTSLNWEPELLTPETPQRIRRTKLFSPLSPVRQSKLDDNDFFIRSNRQTSDLITNNGWLKISRTPGRNIHNESVFCDNEYADYSYLAVAYPLVDDSDTSLDDDCSSRSTSVVSSTSGYLGDESFSLFGTSSSYSSSLASNDSFGYLADVSCTSFGDISEISSTSRTSTADDQVFYSPCESVCRTASHNDADLSSSSSMDDLITTLTKLIIDERTEFGEALSTECATDLYKATSEASNTWQTAEESIGLDNTEEAAYKDGESFDEEAEVSQYGNEWSTDGDDFDSHYPSSLSSGEGNSCSCTSYTCSSYVDISGINLNESSHSAGSEAETERVEDVDSLAIEEFKWEYEAPEEEGRESEEEEGQASNGDQVLAELGAGVEVYDEDQYLVVEAGNETELDVSQLDDDLKYIYTLPY